MTRFPVLGVDIGGVLSCKRFFDSETSLFGSRYLDTPPERDSFEALEQLTRQFEGRVHLVSKARGGPKGLLQRRSREWLRHHGVFSYLDENEQLWFVEDPGEKDFICRELSITHFVDDRLDRVLETLTTVEHRIWFVGCSGADGRTPPGIKKCSTWREVERHIARTLALGHGPS